MAGITELPAAEAKPEDNPQAGSYEASPARSRPAVLLLYMRACSTRVLTCAGHSGRSGKSTTTATCSSGSSQTCSQ